MDQRKRRALAARVERLFDDSALPVVPLEDYLDGNSDDASLGKGMRRDFNLAEYAAVLRDVGRRSDVTEVFVQVHELPDLDEPADDGMWAQANVVFVITSMGTEELERLMPSLAPRFVHVGWNVQPGVRVPAIELPAFRPLRVVLG